MIKLRKSTVSAPSRALIRNRRCWSICHDCFVAAGGRHGQECVTDGPGCSSAGEAVWLSLHRCSFAPHSLKISSCSVMVRSQGTRGAGSRASPQSWRQNRMRLYTSCSARAGEGCSCLPCTQFPFFLGGPGSHSCIKAGWSGHD